MAFICHVCVVANQKGGVGKTTNAMNLAAAITDAVPAIDPERSSVAVVSTDPQGSASYWTERIEKEGQDLPFDFFQEHENPDAVSALKHTGEYQYIIVDTPGTLADTGILVRTLDAADFVLIPVEPEPLGFDATERTIREVIEPRGIPYKVLVNKWDPRDGVADRDDTFAYIDAKGWPRCQMAVRRYKVHSKAALNGLVCTEYPTNRVALEAQKDFYRLALELGFGARQPIAQEA